MARQQLDDELHALKGTEARPRKATVISLSAKGGRPTCPRHLSKVARREWLAAVKLMEARGTLDPGAGPTLEVYATTRERWLVAKADLTKNGLQIEITKSTSRGEVYTVFEINPMLKVAENCEAALQQLTKSLGIDPSAREKVKKLKQAARATGTGPAWLTDLIAKEKQNGSHDSES